jgi:16S rRNA (cytosine967-C5)-methyltransferase
VLERVLRGGAYAAPALDAELRRYPQLSVQERALATELVYGVLRTHGALLHCLRQHARKGLPQGDERLIVQLLMAAYQLMLLERIPAFAAVDVAVAAVRRARGGGLAGFANAVLRKLAASQQRLSPAQAVLENAPTWLVERLEQAVGGEEATALLGASPSGALELPVPTVRLVDSRTVPTWLMQAEKGRVSPRARRVAGRGDLRSQPGYAEGAYLVQEEGAQAVALALGARPGERVLDACAGRGQKATLLREQVGSEGELWACDAYPNKLEALHGEFSRLKLALPKTAAVDWSQGSGAVPAGFDRVLVDAPCSGVGTLRRRPEILLRLKQEAPARLGELATAILRSAAERARPGGRVVFAVCSVLVDEGEAVVRRVADLLQPAELDAPELPSWMRGQCTIRLLPHAHGTDGYFVACFRRK